jgi:hypothetical protein
MISGPIPSPGSVTIVRIADGEDPDVAPRAVDGRRPQRRVDDHHRAGAGVEPGQRLALDIRVAVVRRHDLHRQVGRPRPVAARDAGRRHPLTRDEGDVGRTDRVRIGREVEADLAREHDPERLSLDVLIQQRSDPHRDPPVLRPRWLHLVERPSDELLPVRLVPVLEQLLRGHVTKRGLGCHRSTVAARRATTFSRT